MVRSPTPANSDFDVQTGEVQIRSGRDRIRAFKTAKDGRRYATVVNENGRAAVVWGSRDSTDEELRVSADAKFPASPPPIDLEPTVELEPTPELEPTVEVELAVELDLGDVVAADQPSLVTHAVRRNWIRWIGSGSLVVTCCLLLAMGVCLIIGIRPVVLTTASMSPAAPVGSLLIAEAVEPESVAVGDILVMTRPTGLIVTHRVMERTVRDGLVMVRTKGDSNEDLDPAPYSVVGTHRRSRWVIPSAGKALLLLRTKLFRLLIVASLAAIIVHIGTTELRRLVRPQLVDGRASDGN